MKKFVATLVVFAGLGSVAHAGSISYVSQAAEAVARYMLSTGSLNGIFSIEKTEPVVLPQEQLCKLAMDAQDGFSFFTTNGISDAKVSNYLLISAEDVPGLKARVAADAANCGIEL